LIIPFQEIDVLFIISDTHDFVNTPVRAKISPYVPP
jgi:hypothetical protein